MRHQIIISSLLSSHSPQLCQGTGLAISAICGRYDIMSSRWQLPNWSQGVTIWVNPALREMPFLLDCEVCGCIRVGGGLLKEFSLLTSTTLSFSFQCFRKSERDEAIALLLAASDRWSEPIVQKGGNGRLSQLNLAVDSLRKDLQPEEAAIRGWALEAVPNLYC